MPLPDYFFHASLKIPDYIYTLPGCPVFSYLFVSATHFLHVSYSLHFRVPIPCIIVINSLYPLTLASDIRYFMSGWNNPLPIGQSNGELYGGPWRKFSPGCSEVIAHDARTGEQPPHRTNSRGWKTSLLATTRILVSKLATARVFRFPMANQHVFFPLPPAPIFHFLSGSRLLFPRRLQF